MTASLDRPKITRGGIIAVGLGNALAFYDLIIFSVFAVQISKTIYPTGDPSTELLLTLGTFAIGFLTRPIGALVIGRYGDRRGRKPAMLLSFSLAGLAVFGQALVPSYAAIGMAAPILMLLFRLILGFAMGGEVGPTTAYLVECAPPRHRGTVVSVQYATQELASLVAGIVGFTLAALLTATALESWGWRAAMLLGALIVPFGLFARSKLEETLEFAHDEPDSVAVHGRSPRRLAILGFVMIASATIPTYGLQYLNVYAQRNLGLPAQEAFTATIFYGIAAVIFNLAGGWMSDRLGRKPVMIGGMAILALSLLPGFMLLQASPTTMTLMVVSFWLSLFNAIGPAAGVVCLTEALPPRVRSGSLAISYALAVAVFGGTAQFAITWLLKVTADPLVPAYYVLVAVVIGIVAMAMLPETAPIKARRPAAEPPLSPPEPR
ncbi:MFS transporter [Sphingomonas humi]|uniref:Citrate-proton symporter n=1 Tax=Sphingomonas humi TaxID=335630 RepID=A0ABP7S4N4_9SPHN